MQGLDPPALAGQGTPQPRGDALEPQARPPAWQDTSGLVFSFQIAEQLMTLAYDNGINLFDTAEVYAAGKYVSFLVGKVWCRPWLPWEEPELLVLRSLLPNVHNGPPTLPAFLKSKWLQKVLFAWGQNCRTLGHRSLTKLPMYPNTERTTVPLVPEMLCWARA